ncbi:tubulin polyglutamylase complex subunit 2 isoform X1 [Hydra vulgaris]|nr:tubulin polyglutamylase complex subunit 2 [Hydra vulgaris]
MNLSLNFSNTLAGITLDLIPMLENNSNVEIVQVVEKEPADEALLSAWENAKNVALPKDLKQFYRTMNGLVINWSAKQCGTIIPVGDLKINEINCLSELSLSNSFKSTGSFQLEDLDEDEDECNSKIPRKVTFKDKCFEISSCEGKVCLVYKNVSTCCRMCCAESFGIWFLDRSLRWHYLASTFQQYLRMAVVHMGIKGWQYLFTDAQISPETKYWFNLFIPQRLQVRNDDSKEGILIPDQQ